MTAFTAIFLLVFNFFVSRLFSSVWKVYAILHFLSAEFDSKGYNTKLQILTSLQFIILRYSVEMECCTWDWTAVQLTGM